MSTAVRTARCADAADLATIDGATDPSPWSRTRFEQACTHGGSETVLLAADNGDAAGFVVYSTVLDEGCIHRIAVLPSHRGTGLGRQLLAAALDAMMASGVRRCLLEVRASNSVARNLYAAHGFRLDGVRKNYYASPGGREDAVLMSRQL